MKKILLFTILSFTTFGCKGQELKKTTQKTDTLIPKTKSMYYIPTVNSNFEIFDFQKDKEKYTQTGLAYYDEKSNGYTGTSYKLEEKTENHTTIRDYGLLDNRRIIDPYEFVYYNNSPFMIQKTFYPNGNIKEKGLKIVNGNIYKGIWYYYDENGKLINTIDNDKIFGFSWEQVEKFMEENKIPMMLGNDYHRGISMNRWSPLLYPKSSERDNTQKAGRNLWEITWKGEEWNQYYSVVLDGDTGKMLKRTKYWVSEGPGHHVTDPIIEDFTIVYKTYEGKDYTESEWKIFEQEQYNEHLRKTGRPDLIKPTETPKTDAKKSSFLADEDDVKPKKKKGFWG